MITSNPALWLSSAIACVLLLASATGTMLKLWVARGLPHADIDNLNQRIRSWWIMAAVLGGALWAGKLATFALFAVVSLIALHEYLTASATPLAGSGIVRLSIFAVIPVQYTLIVMEWHTVYPVWVPVVAWAIAPLVLALAGGKRDALPRSADLQWGWIISAFCIPFIPALLTLEIQGYHGGNVFLLVFLILVTQASDVLQYLWGKLFGKHRITPALSPSKTVEGFIGGIISATLVGASLWWITPFSPLQAAAVSLLITVLGIVSGLLMSFKKRAHGIKDWGALIGGHGGVLDRVDSVLLPAPLFFYFVKSGWVYS